MATCEGDRDDNDPNSSPADLDEDGVSSADGDCNDLDAAVVPSDSDGDGFSSESTTRDDSNRWCTPLPLTVPMMDWSAPEGLSRWPLAIPMLTPSTMD